MGWSQIRCTAGMRQRWPVKDTGTLIQTGTRAQTATGPVKVQKQTVSESSGPNPHVFVDAALPAEADRILRGELLPIPPHNFASTSVLVNIRQP